MAGLPPGVDFEFLPDAVPAKSTLVINTSCATAPGSHVFDVWATISETMQMAKVTVNIVDSLVDSQPGSYTGSFTLNTIGVSRGGPSTYQYGPFLVLQFCGTGQPRKLTVEVQSAISEADTPLAQPPRFSLFRSMVWPVPDHIQTMSGGYQANAREVAQSDGWNLEWDIADGLYVVAFQRSPFEDSLPANERPASVAYRVEIVR